jgi:PAS domain S-box-containing protein
MGAFCAFDKYYGRPFDMEDARLLSMMARQVSAVLVTSQLFWKERDRSNKLRAVLESTSVGLMAVSPKGSVTQINQSARRALDISSDGWFGRHFHELVGEPQIRSIIDDALAGNPPEQPKELTMRVRAQDDTIEERIYRIQIDQVRWEDSQSLGWVIVFENVTDIRQAERMMDDVPRVADPAYLHPRLCGHAASGGGRHVPVGDPGRVPPDRGHRGGTPGLHDR